MVLMNDNGEVIQYGQYTYNQGNCVHTLINTSNTEFESKSKDSNKTYVNEGMSKIDRKLLKLGQEHETELPSTSSEETNSAGF